MGDVIEIRRRTRVLLVEDEPLISEIAVEALEEQGFVVEVVTNAFDALRRLASGRPIDILFTDINLAGGVDGATPGTPGAPTPSRPAGDLYVRAVRHGRLERVEGAMFVPKPYDAFSIGRLLNQLIAAKRTRLEAFA